MSQSTPPTPSQRAPAGVPPSGNGKYIAIVVVLLIGTVAIVASRSCGKEQNAQVPKPLSTIDAAPTPHERPEDLVPPPPPVEDSGPETHATTKPTSSGDPCAVKTCNGTAPGELEAALAFRAKQAHRCYDMALAADNTLRGKVGITVRVAANGQVCRADVASNDMGTNSVAQCVANMFRTSGHFPPPKGGCVDATVPINFVPGGK